MLSLIPVGVWMLSTLVAVENQGQTLPALPAPLPPVRVDPKPETPQTWEKIAVVLPVKVHPDIPGGQEAAVLLTSMLTSSLAQQGSYKVIGQEEVDAVLKVEATRQAVGCEDDVCLAEILGALGARYVVTGDIVPVSGSLLWTESLADRQTHTVVNRMAMQGRSVQSFSAQVEEVAAVLCGKQAETDIRAPDARERFGFASDAEFAQFRTFRATHPELTTGESLTKFIIARNKESTRLAWLQAALFSGAGMLAVAASLAQLELGDNLLADFLQVPELTPGAYLLSILLGSGAVVLGLSGIVAVVVDMLDKGRVTVHESGCCRNDADIHQEERDDRAHLTAAMAVLMSGPGHILMGLLAQSVLFPLSYAGTLLRFSSVAVLPERSNVPAIVTCSNQCASGCLALPACVVGCAPLCLNTPIGLALVLKRPAPLLTKGSPPPRTSPDEEERDEELDMEDEDQEVEP